MTTFYEGDNTGLRELTPPRYTPAVDDNGKWGVVDTVPTPLFLAIRYQDMESAEALADLMNAVDEGEDLHVIEDLRRDLDRVRQLARPK